MNKLSGKRSKTGNVFEKSVENQLILENPVMFLNRSYIVWNILKPTSETGYFLWILGYCRLYFLLLCSLIFPFPFQNAPSSLNTVANGLINNKNWLRYLESIDTRNLPPPYRIPHTPAPHRY